VTWQLRTTIYDAKIPGYQEISELINGLRIRATLHGGVQAIEFELADDYVDSYRWAYDHIGCNVYIFDNHVNPPVAEGVIMEPGISERGNHVVAYGPWLAYMYRRIYNNTASWVTTGTTGQQVQHILTNECPDISTDQSNVGDPGTNNFPWQPVDNQYPGDLVEHLASLSDASNNEWYFWLRSPPMAGTTPRSPVPWFKAASSITKVYQCWREDMTPGGLDLTPSLRELANDVRVMYRDYAGTVDQTASATDAISQARWWLREVWDNDLGSASAANAAQYRDLLLARYKDPQQAASFRLNTWVYDEWGGKFPLWRILADFPVKFTVNDLIPDSTVLGHILDDKRTFVTLVSEYDYDSNTLTVVPDTEDNRADAMLARHRAFR